MSAGLKPILHRLRTHTVTDAGQSLVLVVLAAFMVIMIGAYVIDFAVVNTKHQQVQNATDAAALAAANCLANAGIAGPCSSTTDTTDAISVATAMAQQNNVTVSTSQVSINTTSYQVTVQGSSSLAGLFPFGDNGQGKVANAQAAATYTPPSNVTGTYKTAPKQCLNGDIGSGNCIAMFAGGVLNGGTSQNCPMSSFWYHLLSGIPLLTQFGHGVTDGVAILGLVPLGSLGDTVAGAIVSNGNIDFNSAFGGTGNMYHGPGCWANASLFSGTGNRYGLSANQPYPQSWTYDSGTAKLTSNSGQTLPCTVTVTKSTPSSQTYQNGIYTNIANGNISFTGLGLFSNPQIPSGVYCAPQGSISITNFTFIGTLTGNVSFYSNSISGFDSITTAMKLCPYGSTVCPWTNDATSIPSNRLLMYQSGSSTLSVGTAWTSLSGTVYAPSASIGINQLASSVGFLEGQDIALYGVGGYYGAGPEVSSSGTVVTTTQTPTPGIDSLSG